MATPEGKVKARLDKALHQMGVWFFSPQSGPYGRSGVPDRIACVNGHFIGLEVKADSTKKPTRLQVDCMRKIENAGGKCFVVCNDDTMAAALTYIRRTMNAGNPPRQATGAET